LKPCLAFKNGRNIYKPEQKALVTFTLRLSHVSVDVKATSVSQSVSVSVDMCASISIV